MREVEFLERRVNNLESRLAAIGIPTEMWLGLDDAGKMLGNAFGKDKLTAEIERAEKALQHGETPDLVYGVHYTNVQSPSHKKRLFKVDPVKLREVLIQTPPAQRPIYSWEKE